MQGRIVLITGANQGLGKASAIALGRMGATLVLVCRNAEKGRAAVDAVAQAGGGNAEFIDGDLSSQAEVRRVAAEFRTRHDHLHVLLNNAGVIVPSRRTTVDGIEETFAINHLAYFLLTEQLLAPLQAAAPSRIVNVSSEAHRTGQMHWDDLQLSHGNYRAFTAYRQSKLCNILFTAELARRLAGTAVTANCLHPGFVATGFGSTYGGYMAPVIRMAMAVRALSVDNGKKTQVWLASAPEVAGISGKYFQKCQERLPNIEAQSAASARRLWEISEQMTAASAASAATPA